MPSKVIWVCVCSLRYPECNACFILYGHLLLVWLHNIFTRYLINDTIFANKLRTLKRVFWLSLQTVSEKSHLKKIQRDTIINVNRTSFQVLVILLIRTLTHSLLMSYIYIYIYGAPSKARNLTSYIRICTRLFAGDFASWTVHFANVCVKNQQIHQLFIHFINYVW
jgi:hypothetical protein